MSNLTPALGIGGITGASLLVAEIVLTGHSQVPIETAVGVGVFACGCVWWLSKKFQSTDDKLSEVANEVRSMKSKMRCYNFGECPEDVKGKV